MRGRFGDLITAMVTPFDASGGLSISRAQEIASFLIDTGSEGVVLAGSTGEGPVLTDEEKVSLFRAGVEAIGGRGSVIANTGTYSTAHTIHLTNEAEKAGVDAALVVTPYYNRPPQEGLLAHFKAVAEATSLPIILYDIPVRTGREIELTTLVQLAGIDNIVGVKDACGDVQKTARLTAEAPGEFQVWSGNDADTLPWLSVGAVGVIAVASHVAGPQMSEMIASYKSGNVEAALKIHLDLMPVFDAMGITTNPIPVKAGMRLIGRDAGDPRLPLVAASKEQVDKIRGVLARAGIV